MDVTPLRLNPGDDLRQALSAALDARGHGGAFVIAGIGSLHDARLRLAGTDVPITIEGDCEILTLSGTLTRDGPHLHMSVSDALGRVTGGHVAPGCTVRTTAEVLVGWLAGVTMRRRLDAATGYAELVIDAQATKNADIS